MTLGRLRPRNDKTLEPWGSAVRTRPWTPNFRRRPARISVDVFHTDPYRVLIDKIGLAFSAL
jgi:hypothetical protein